MKDKDINSLEHTSWRCQYHIVFAPKYRRMEIYGQIKQDIGVILRKLCQQKGVEIIEDRACPDHIHMLISIPSKYSVSQTMGYLKGKSSLMIFDRYANLKYKYGNRHFWARGYYVDTVGRNKKLFFSSLSTVYIPSKAFSRTPRRILSAGRFPVCFQKQILRRKSPYKGVLSAAPGAPAIPSTSRAL